MMPQKKSGTENLSLKAVIALLGAAAATAVVLSRLAKDLGTGSISLTLSLWKPWGRGVAH